MSLGKEYVIALVDCDCFFVSCERVDNPNLNGRAVCVVTNTTNKGIVLSRSNEAKALGIKMGQPMFQLNGRHLDCFYIPCRHKRYAELSRQVMAVLREFSPDVEDVSVDEAFLDLTGMSKIYGVSYEKLAHQIRQRVFEKTKIPVSIGVSTSKTLAKLASDKAKKNGGVFIIAPKKIREILSAVKLDEVCGISHQTVKNFYKKGVFELNEFLDKDPAWVRQALGITGERLRYELSGVCVSPVNAVEQAPQSIQDTRSLVDFTGSLEMLERCLPCHIHRSSQKLRKWDGYCAVLSVMLRTKDFKVHEAEIKLPNPTNSEQTLLRQAHILIKKIYNPRVLYRSVGVTLKNLTFGKVQQGSLFDSVRPEDDKLSHLIDELEQRYGKQVVKLGM